MLLQLACARYLPHLTSGINLHLKATKPRTSGRKDAPVAEKVDKIITVTTRAPACLTACLWVWPCYVDQLHGVTRTCMT